MHFEQNFPLTKESLTYSAVATKINVALYSHSEQLKIRRQSVTLPQCSFKKCIEGIKEKISIKKLE